MRRILINEPGAGAWVMAKVGGHFNEVCDHSICTYSDDRLLGGFVVSGYTGRSMVVHMAGRDGQWCSRDLMWMLFDYSFHQLGLRKLIATVSSVNVRALDMDLRAGWRLAAVIEDAFDDGHMMILSMDPSHCKWLKHTSKSYYRSG